MESRFEKGKSQVSASREALDGRCGYCRDGLNHPCVHAAVNDAVRLAMMHADLYLRNHLIGRGTDKMDTHGEIPAFSRIIESVSEVTVRRSGKARLIGHSWTF